MVLLNDIYLNMMYAYVGVFAKNCIVTNVFADRIKFYMTTSKLVLIDDTIKALSNTF